MLIAALEVSTNAASEYSLMARIGLREVFIVGTQTTSTGSPTTQANPAATAATANAGTKQPSEVKGWHAGP